MSRSSKGISCEVKYVSDTLLKGPKSNFKIVQFSENYVLVSMFLSVRDRRFFVIAEHSLGQQPVFPFSFLPSVPSYTSYRCHNAFRGFHMTVRMSPYWRAMSHNESWKGIRLSFYSTSTRSFGFVTGKGRI